MDEINVEKALNFIRDIAKEFAEAKAERVYIEQFRKSKKAILSKQYEGGTINDKDNYAYSHKDYLSLLEGLKAAVEKEERLKYQIIAAQLKVEVWRTQQANSRIERKGYGA